MLHSQIVLHTFSSTLKFYSWYIYPKEGEEYGQSVSAARYVDGTLVPVPFPRPQLLNPNNSFYRHFSIRFVDVNEDPVILIDGLTKNFRLPGWRVCWVIGPKNLVSALSQSGAFSF